MWFSNTDVLVFSADLGLAGSLTASPGILVLSDVDISDTGKINSHILSPREAVGLLTVSLGKWMSG